MKTRYKLHWASGRGTSPELKWEIWDWTILAPIAYLENRAIGRRICALLNADPPVVDPPLAPKEDDEKKDDLSRGDRQP